MCTFDSCIRDPHACFLQTGDTALTLACRFGHLEAVLLLLEKGCDANLQNKTGMSAVMWACKGQHVEVVEALMDRFVETNHEEVEKDRFTALMWAAESSDPRIARALLRSQTTDVDLVSLSVCRPHCQQLVSTATHAVRFLHTARKSIPR